MGQRQETHSMLIGYILCSFGFGLLYDMWTLNGQVSEINMRESF